MMINRIENLVEGKHRASAHALARPETIDEFVGQGHLKSLIRTAVVSARQRNAPFPHSLVTGAAGLGKTSIARLIATEMGALFVPTTAEAMIDSSIVKGLISRLDATGYDGRGEPVGKINPSILFIDEGHRLARPSQELLYSCIEDRLIDTRVRDILSGLLKPVREWVPYFTLIVATNRPGDLTTSFRDRLRLNLRLENYDEKDSSKIARQALLKMGLSCSSKTATTIAARGRGVPRRIIGLCEQIRDIAISTGKEAATPSICRKAFDALGIDPAGLSRQDVELLRYLAQNIGQPLGLQTLASLLGEEERAVEDAIEPYLLARGLIARTQRGRALTDAGLQHLQHHHGYESNGRSLP